VKTTKKFAALLVLAVAFFAAPAMAGCSDEASMQATAEGALAFGMFPANMNYDLIKHGDQEALTFGAPFGSFGADPVATNAFNVKKNQKAGSSTQTQMREFKEFSQSDDFEAADMCGYEYGANLINIEMINFGDQKAMAIGRGTASNTVNIEVEQCGCCPDDENCCCGGPCK
jgi:hypothetical protein